ncbi:MAG: pentapeptide repeat-containing protein [Oscillospiraceae bacterium]|nr:pentapeptide repeat-containing protein [Oscillospiraceae bacterium]
MREDFITQANNWRNEYLLKTEELFVANKSRWFADFYDHFRDICAKLRKMQDELVLPAISYLEYTMLYNNFINRHYVSEIFVYNDKSYLDKNHQFIGEYDISFLFVYFDEMWDKLLSGRKCYVGKVTAQEITTFMLRTLSDFYSYFTNIIRFTILSIIDESSLANINKNEKFMVNVGDYMAKTEAVFVEQKVKDAKKLNDLFSKQPYSQYIFGDYSRLDFSGKVLSDMDFRFARFSSSTLINTSFEGSSLIGANFRNADMERCRLDYCTIQEADFSNASLKNASFRNARTKLGLMNEKAWEFVGFLPTNFRNADLTGADFTGANLDGADFTNAVLTGVDFTDTILDNAIFDETKRC